MTRSKSLMRSIRTTLILAVIGALAGGITASLMPVSYESSLSFTVNQINKQETTDYQFDGYYAIQASDLFSETIVSWFQTPSFLLEIYNRAEVDPQIESIGGFTSRFKMRKFSAQNLVLNFSEKDELTAEKLSTAIISHVEERANELNQNAERKALFEVVGSNPVIVKKEITVFEGILYGFLAGLVLGLFVVSVMSAFSKLENDQS